MKSFGAWIGLALVFFFAGQYGRTQVWFSYLHEYGHVWAAEREGRVAVITGPYETSLPNGDVTKSILVSGYWTELLVWSGLGIVFSFARWDGVGGVPFGFCAGFATRVYVMAQAGPDFIRVGQDAYSQWHVYGVLTLAIMYLIVARRLYKWWRQYDASSSDSKVKSGGAHPE